MTASCGPAAAASSVASSGRAVCSVPSGMRSVRPDARMAARLAPRAITVTGCPERISRAARYPPMAPAPTMAILMRFPLPNTANARAFAMTLRRSLPVPTYGSDSRKWMRAGTLKSATCSAQCRRSSCSVAGLLNTTAAWISSPSVMWGTPNASASPTAGWRRRT